MALAGHVVAARLSAEAVRREVPVDRPTLRSTREDYMASIASYFELKKRGTTVGTEVREIGRAHV